MRLIQRTPLCPHVAHPPRLNARRHTTKSTAAARRHRARRHQAALVDEAGTRGRSSERAAVERSTASRRQVPRPRQEEKQHACEPLDLTARSPSDGVFRNTLMQTTPQMMFVWVSVVWCCAPVVPGHVVSTTFLSRFLRRFLLRPPQTFFTAFLTRF